MEILVVEDQADLARHIVGALNRAGHTATALHDGLEGLNAILAKPPHLVILDLNLPSLDGFSILGRLRKAEPGSGVVPGDAVSPLAGASITVSAAALSRFGLSVPARIKEHVNVQ